MKASALMKVLEQRGLTPAIARRVVVTAVTNGALHEIRSGPAFEDCELRGEVPESIILAEIYRQLPEGIVATAPVTVPNTRLTLEVLGLIIAASEAEVLVASPYIDRKGVEQLAKPLAALGERDVSVHLLTRETSLQQERRTAGIRHLFELLGRGLEVRDYHAAPDGRHVAAVHAKLLMADAKIGYVGSAELRWHSLVSNFEMGYIFHQGRAAVAARRAFMTFWDIASPVDILCL